MGLLWENAKISAKLSYFISVICLRPNIGLPAHSNNTLTRSMAAGFGRHGMPPPASNVTGTAVGHDGSDWSRDLATLTFDLGGHGACGWCGSSSSIRIPSLKFVGLAVRKIWRTMCVSINGPGDLDLWPFDLETSVRVASKVGTFLSNFDLWVLELFSMYATDRRTDKSKAYYTHLYSPYTPYGRRHRIITTVTVKKLTLKNV